MYSILQVFFGGITGTTLRYIIAVTTPSLWMLYIVNIVGSFLLGSINKYYEKKNTNKFKLFFTTGLLGSFTTFSSFSEQWFSLLQENLLLGCSYGISMMILCITAAFFGYKVVR